MVRGTFWLLAAVLNVYLASFLRNDGQSNFSLVIALYCAVVAVFYYYSAAKGVK